MADDNIKSTVVRKARVSFVKDNIQTIVHYETDSTCIKDLNEAIVNGIANIFNNDDEIRDVIYQIVMGGEQLSDYAKLDSPSFIGEPKAPTIITSDSSTKIANTEYVTNKVSALEAKTASKTDLDKYVSKTGADTITGIKTFNNDINISDAAGLYWKNGDVITSTLNKNTYSGTANKAIRDQNDNVINTTYATKVELNEKQNTLTFDNTPTEDSTNPVTSGGVYNAILDNAQTVLGKLATVATTGSYTDLKNTPILGDTETLGLTKIYGTTGNNSDGTITQAVITNLLAYKADRDSLAAIATTGSWNDIVNIPTANDTTRGVLRLYPTLGDNTNGAVTQVGMKTILEDYAKLTDIATTYKYKGTLDNYSDLPSQDNTVGDVYNITNADKDHNIDAGDNVAWNGTDWDNLSGLVDLSAYSTTEENNALYLGINDNAVSATNAKTSKYIEVENSNTDSERYVIFARDEDGNAGTSPSSTRVVFNNNFTYNPNTDVLKVGNINSENIIKSITVNNNTIVITKGNGLIESYPTIDDNTEAEVIAIDDSDIDSLFRNSSTNSEE